MNSLETKRLLMDLDISMRSSDCPYTVHFHGAMFREGDVWICMEVMDISLDKFYARAFGTGDHHQQQEQQKQQPVTRKNCPESFSQIKFGILKLKGGGHDRAGHPGERAGQDRLLGEFCPNGV